MKSTPSIKTRRSPCFEAVVALMVVLTVHLGFAQVSPPHVVEPGGTGNQPTSSSGGLNTSAADHQKPIATDSGVRVASDPVGWFDATIDADFNDRFIQEKLEEIGHGVTNALLHVRNQIGYEAYEGSLRGARGTMWSEAGNSLDQASLLVALLRGQGIGARYVHGTLSTVDQQALIRSMFDPVAAANAVGYIPERFTRSDPEHSAGLLNAVADHWWVELEDGTALDPCFADATVGAVRGTKTATFFEVPDELRHKVVVRLKTEFHNLLSQYTGQTPLEVTFSTAEVYGKPVTLGHFVGIYQPSSMFIGFQTYTYSPYLMVDDNDDSLANNHLIRGTDFQEFFSGSFPIANMTLTRVTLEFETRAPGGQPEVCSRDLLDRVGFAARHGLAQPGPVDTTRPALTEFDLATINVLPGWFHPPAVVPQVDALTNLQAQAEALAPAMKPIAQKDPATLTAAELGTVTRYNALLRLLQAANTHFLNSAFLIDADYWTKLAEEQYLVRAWFESPRLILTQTRMRADAGTNQARGSLSLDIRKDNLRAVPYPGQNSRADFSFNLARGFNQSLIEHLVFEGLITTNQTVRPAAPSAVAVFTAAKEQNVPIGILQGAADIRKLESLPLSPETKTRITQALLNHQAVNVPAGMVDLDGQPSIAWYEIDAVTGEMFGVMEDGGHQEAIEFSIILTLIATAGCLTLALLGQNISGFFNLPKAIDYKSFGNSGKNHQPMIAPSAEMHSTATQAMPIKGLGVDQIKYNEDGSVEFSAGGQVITIPSDVNPLSGQVFECTGSPDSVIRWSALHLEVQSLLNPGPSLFSDSVLRGPDFTLELVPEPALSVAVSEANLESAFRARITNSGDPAPANLSGYSDRIGQSFLFMLTGSLNGLVWGTDIFDRDSALATAAVHAGVLTIGQTGTVKVTVLGAQPSYTGSTRNGVTSHAYSGTSLSYRFDSINPSADQAEFRLSGISPAGWKLLFARTNALVPAGVTGDTSVFLQPQQETALPPSGTVLPFTLTVAHADNPSLSVTQQVNFTMPEVHGLSLTATPETLYLSPNGTTPLELAILNTGNVTQNIALSLSLPTNFTVTSLGTPLLLAPCASSTQSVNVTALGAPVDSEDYGALTATYGGTNAYEKRVELRLHVAAPGAVQALDAANNAEALNRDPLGSTLEALGDQLSQLYGSPSNEVYRSCVLASLASLIRQLDDPLLAPLAADLEAARQAIAAAATPTALLTALEALGTAMTPFASRLALMAEHDFEVSLQPNAVAALPEMPTTFGLYLKNNSRRTTTYNLSLSPLPAGISGGLDRTNITLAPGEAISPTMGFKRVNVVLTQPAHELTAFNFAVTVTAEGAPEITRTAEGAFTAREELVRVVAAETAPPMVSATENGFRLFTGGDAGERLDLDGTFAYAVSLGATNAPGRIRDAEFTSTNVPGVTVRAASSGWATLHNVPNWYSPDFGSSANDNRLEAAMSSMVWVENYGTLELDLGNLDAGRPYKLQLLFAEPYDPGFGRKFDVSVEGTLIAEAFKPIEILAGSPSTNTGVVLTREFIATDSTLNIVLDGQRYGSQDSPALCGLTFEAEARALPRVRARLLNAVNTDRDVLLRYTLKDAQGATLEVSTPQRARLSVLSSLDTFDLGELDTTGLSAGAYTVEVEVQESDGSATATGTGTLLVGAPIRGELIAATETVPPGNSRVGVSLNIASLLQYETNALPLLGLVDTPGDAVSLAVRGNHAYLGTHDPGVATVAVADLRNPRFVRNLPYPSEFQFVALAGDTLLAAEQRWASLGAYSLTNPASPARIGTATSRVNEMVISTFPDFLTVQGDYAFLQCIVYGWSGETMLFVRGDVLLFDIATPTNPFYRGLLYGTPHTDSPQNVGSDYIIGQPGASRDGIVLLPSSTAKNGAVGGTGLLRIVDTLSGTNPVVVGEFQVPGTTLLQGIAVHEDRALVLGNKGGVAVVNGGPAMPGNPTLTLLDVSNPRVPSVLSPTIELPNIDVTERHSMKVFGGENGLYVVSRVQQSGAPYLILVNARDPLHLVVTWLPAPGTVAYAKVERGLLYTASSSGLAIYDLGGLMGVPVTARVRVPRDGSATIASGSFNVPPDQIIAGTNFDTLVWNVTLSSNLTNQVFTWQVNLTNVQPGEARDLTLGGTVDFTALGTEGSIELPPVRVVGEQILALDPASQTVPPGAPADFTLTVKNPTATPVTYNLAVQGVPSGWVSLPAEVTVPAQSQIQRTFQIASETSTAQGECGFTVTAQAGAGAFSGAVSGTLVLSGFPAVPRDSHRVLVTLNPPRATAGQGTPAQFMVRLVNTGNTTELFDLLATMPEGFSATFGAAKVEVPPGLENYREVALSLTPCPGTAAGDAAFAVTATNNATQGQATGIVNVVSLGVALAFDPPSGPPGNTFNLCVTNTGTSAQTFELLLGGPAAPSALLSQTSVTLNAGAWQRVPVTVAELDYAYTGGLPLIALATARADTNVQARATASVQIPTTHGLTATFEPPRVGLPGPGCGFALLVVRNTGNTEDAFIARIANVNGPLTAQLQKATGQFAQQIDSIRLPGLTGGAILLAGEMSHAGTGTVQVAVSSLEHSNTIALATVTFLAGVWLSMGPEWIIDLSFTPVPGADHFFDYSECVQPGLEQWHEVPGGPYNRGWYYLSLPGNAAAFTFDYADTNRLFLESADRPSRYYRLRTEGVAAPLPHMQLVPVQALKFDPVPGFDHVIQCSDQLGPEAQWIDLPRSPHNQGLAFDPRTETQRFYRVLIRPQMAQ